jgi:transcriptional regulator with XRE-family HTH domain
MSGIGDKIKNARNAKGLSQKQLAKKLGVAEGFINEVESGRKVVNEKLMDRIGKVLGGDLENMSSMLNNLIVEEEKARDTVKRPTKVVEAINDVWNDALGSVLKSVGIYKYDLNKPTGKRELPIISNKIEGFSQDKVLYLEIEDDDLMGFRICKGDLAFANLTSEVENNAICLIDYNGERVLRQIKKLDANKVLLISNRGSLRTETVAPKDIKVIAKLNRLEIKL